MSGERNSALTPESAFDVALDNLTLPEIEQERASIEASARELIGHYGIEAGLFDRAHSVFFAALAQRHARLRRGMPTLKGYEQSMAFIGDATVMLAWDKQAGFEEVKWQIDADAAAISEKPGETGKAYQAFTNHAMTARLHHASDTLFGDVRQKLGHEELPYDLHVLDIGFTEEWAWDGYEALQLSDADKERLRVNALQFRDTGNMSFAGMSKGWVTSVDGRCILALPWPVAAMALREDAQGDESLKVLQHEYAHTQHDVTLDGRFSYGVIAEERRADIATDYVHYDNIAYFMDADLHIVSGKVMSHTVKAHVASRDNSDFWVQMARDFGLQTTLELGLVVPEAHINENIRPLQARVNAHIGGMDGITKRMYEENCQDPQKKAAMDARIERYVAWFDGLPSSEADAATQYSRDIDVSFMMNVIRERSTVHPQ